MRRFLIGFALVLFVFSFQNISAQIGVDKNLSTINIDDLSDNQVLSYWSKAKEEGYSIPQLEMILSSKGMPSNQISKLKRRIQELKYSNSENENKGSNESSNTINTLEKFGLEGGEKKVAENNLLFGYDFFKNPKISFTPNLNLATPDNYQLGPGDEILIDVWGAAENNYNLTIDKAGSIRIKNIGPIYVSGLTIKKAKSKIKSYLKRIYSGIGASNSSYNKVYAEIALTSARTVQVNIIGEVSVPGTYSLSSLSTVLNALYASGGPTLNGTFRTIKIVRNGDLFKEFDIYKYLINGSEEGNVFLRDQDVIIVQPYISKVRVDGEVKRPGFYELKKGESIGDLIRFFGGFTSQAYKERLLVERVYNGQKKVNEIDLKNNTDFLLKDGDRLNINQIIDRYENRVSIEGAIYRPGNYEITEGLTLRALIEKAGGLKDNAFLERGLVYRTFDDVKKETFPFSTKDIINKQTDVILKREDRVIIFNKESLESKKTLSIDGAVNNPQTIDFVDKMNIEDFIAISGGFKEGADPETIDVSRRTPNGGFQVISKSINKSISNDLVIDKNNSVFYLKPFDIVSIRYKKGFTIQKNVSIEGEVTHPGNYSITNKNERISDLILRAGGLSPHAYIKGATLVRKTNKSVDENQIKRFNEVNSKDSLNIKKENRLEFNIGISLEEILKNKGKKSKYDLILNEGDKLIIPTLKQTVHVKGEVLAEAIVRYDKNASLNDYISSSGGFSENAIKRKTYVIYANGEVNTTKTFLFFKNYPKIEPGSIVIVPRKIEKKRASTQEIIGITSGLATLGVLISTLVK
ncbi:SLBB domain-containing protein [Lutibacter sp. Hel_I_33_5]|uniref:SLBB domain-containing protein n=1 Tax=Lutibacter sp. Hel_I_33_5 TaxID=1566289 RepID=UPI0011A7A8CD|nr:SLBB domain-containing protein [Lutibacter sp. Hel_I_33_5]